MSVSNIGSIGATQGNYSGNETRSIDQKIQQLQKQIEKVQSDDKLSTEEKDKRIKNLQEQIKRLQEQKAKLEQKKSNEVSESENTNAIRGDIEVENSVNQNIIDILA